MDTCIYIYIYISPFGLAISTVAFRAELPESARRLEDLHVHLVVKTMSDRSVFYCRSIVTDIDILNVMLPSIKLRCVIRCMCMWARMCTCVCPICEYVYLVSCMARHCSAATATGPLRQRRALGWPRWFWQRWGPLTPAKLDCHSSKWCMCYIYIYTHTHARVCMCLYMVVHTCVDVYVCIRICMILLPWLVLCGSIAVIVSCYDRHLLLVGCVLCCITV